MCAQAIGIQQDALNWVPLSARLWKVTQVIQSHYIQIPQRDVVKGTVEWEALNIQDSYWSPGARQWNYITLTHHRGSVHCINTLWWWIGKTMYCGSRMITSTQWLEPTLHAVNWREVRVLCAHTHGMCGYVGLVSCELNGQASSSCVQEHVSSQYSNIKSSQILTLTYVQWHIVKCWTGRFSDYFTKKHPQDPPIRLSTHEIQGVRCCSHENLSKAITTYRQSQRGMWGERDRTWQCLLPACANRWEALTHTLTMGRRFFMWLGNY